mmetsp:Transcript_16410/g.51407  ORF Transcript_16410/g.51407 Transcript_16410/m.51407 type:complete len:130 (+) Transcript_16410:75-464(+)
MAEAGEFPTGLFGCCSVKDCGIGCCLKLYCCGVCNYGSAMEAAELGACCPCCCAFSMCPWCVGTYNRGRLAEKYNIDESIAMSCLVYFCCACCASIQDMNLVCVKENKTWGCCALESSGAPCVAEQPGL